MHISNTLSSHITIYVQFLHTNSTKMERPDLLKSLTVYNQFPIYLRLNTVTTLILFLV